MLNAHIGLVLMAPLLLTLGYTPSANGNGTSVPSTHLKCRNASQQTPLYFVDGRLVSADSMQKLAPNTAALRSISVTCVNPVDSTALPGTSNLPGIPAVAAWTLSGPASLLNTALNAIRDAQQTQFAKTGRYSRDIAALPKLPDEVKVTFESTSTGWDATVWLDRMFSPRCRMFGGTSTSVGALPTVRKPVEAGVIVCDE